MSEYECGQVVSPFGTHLPLEDRGQVRAQWASCSGRGPLHPHPTFCFLAHPPSCQEPSQGRPSVEHLDFYIRTQLLLEGGYAPMRLGVGGPVKYSGF